MTTEELLDWAAREQAQGYGCKAFYLMGYAGVDTGPDRGGVLDRAAAAGVADRLQGLEPTPANGVRAAGY